MTALHEGSIGDLIRAARALALEPSDWHQIAPLLGLRLGTATESAKPRSSESYQSTPSDERSADRMSRLSGRPAPASRDITAKLPPPVPATLRTITTSGPPPPVWLAPATERVAAPGPEHRRRPPPDPLLSTRWVPGIISSLVATARASSEIDTLRVVDQIARGNPVDRVPRRTQSTLARGAQILVDMGPAMVPFAHDQAALVRSARDVLGGGPAEVLRFDGCPLRGAGPGPRPTWGAYEPPATPRPILVLTDLGIGGPRLAPWRVSTDEWLEFERTVTQAGCPVVALVPYPPQRVPKVLRRRVYVVVWDRPTSVATVRRSLRGPLNVA